MKQLLIIICLFTCTLPSKRVVAQYSLENQQYISLLTLMPSQGTSNTIYEYYDIDPENHDMQYVEAYNQIITRNNIPLARVIATQLIDQLPLFDELASDFYGECTLYEKYQVQAEEYQLWTNVVDTEEEGLQFCTHFSMRLKDGKCLIQKFENSESYHSKGMRYNFNIWARSPDDLVSIFLEIIRQVEAMDFTLAEVRERPLSQKNDSVDFYTSNGLETSQSFIYDLNGRLIYSGVTNDNQAENLEMDLPSGYYFTIKIEDGKVVERRKWFQL